MNISPVKGGRIALKVSSEPPAVVAHWEGTAMSLQGINKKRVSVACHDLEVNYSRDVAVTAQYDVDCDCVIKICCCKA